MPNTLYYGDNLSVLRKWVEDESIDLIYLDPPFNSKKLYNQCFKGSVAQERAFKDYWEWDDAAEDAYRQVTGTGSPAPRALATILESFYRFFGSDRDTMMAYLAMMSIRLVELKRVLKPGGMMYLHCDPTASHYLKICLDALFGGHAFASEIVWQRTNARSTTGGWPRLHDILLCYCNGETPAVFNPTTARVGALKMPHTLITGPDGHKYQTFELTGPGVTVVGDSGKPWRGFDPAKLGQGRHWGNDLAEREAWAAAGLIHFPPGGGWPRRRAEKPFSVEDREIIVGDVWTDIDRLNQTAAERLGYPTQKPKELLERIILASSKPGEIVLDPFCGCGTAIEASFLHGRDWIGIDIAPRAIDIIRSERLDKLGIPYDVVGWPTDIDGAGKLALEDKLGFQRWAVFAVGGRTPEKSGKRSGGGDGGVDGEIIFEDAARKLRAVISVKAGAINPSAVRDLIGTVSNEAACMGLLVTMNEPTKGMRDAAREAGMVRSSAGEDVRKVQILTAAQVFAGVRVELPGRNVTPESKRGASVKGETLSMHFADEKRKKGSKKTAYPERPAVSPEPEMLRVADSVPPPKK